MFPLITKEEKKNKKTRQMTVTIRIKQIRILFSYASMQVVFDSWLNH